MYVGPTGKLAAGCVSKLSQCKCSTVHNNFFIPDKGESGRLSERHMCNGHFEEGGGCRVGVGA